MRTLVGIQEGREFGRVVRLKGITGYGAEDFCVSSVDFAYLLRRTKFSTVGFDFGNYLIFYCGCEPIEFIAVQTMSLAIYAKKFSFSLQ